ncbi:MAG: helix-turn-helix transcriptional regulator [Lachnospiraceae bacterium]|nr:helix-turn-helix transcriptional regulator [Lachnospiraceae bacterium]
MNSLFEYGDILNSPVEAFLFDTDKHTFPVEAHWHYYIEILYMIEGTAHVTCNQENYILHPGEMIFLPPQAVHAIYGAKPQTLKYVVLKFDGNRLQLLGSYLPKISSVFCSTTKTLQLPITFSQKDFSDFALENFFEQCVKEMKDRQYGYDTYIFSAISQLLVHMLRIWRLHGYSQENDTVEKNEDFSIHDVLMYIDTHSQENIRVENLAKMCNMSYSYFAKTFHKLYGQSCKEYIEFVRLSKVENLLLFTNYDLNYISNETGFADCSHLIRVFKRKYHITPKQFRMRYSS